MDVSERLLMFVDSEGLLGNEDDDYFMDELEGLRDKQGLFLKELENQRVSFTEDPAATVLYERLRVAVGAVGQNSSRRLGVAGAAETAAEP